MGGAHDVAQRGGPARAGQSAGRGAAHQSAGGRRAAPQRAAGAAAQAPRVLHFNVTEHPTAQWTAQQLVDAFPNDTAPSYLLRDAIASTGSYRVKGMGIEEVLPAPQSPWQNPFVERLINSIRRECLNHVLVLGERDLRRILARYFAYYHNGPTSPSTRTRPT